MGAHVALRSLQSDVLAGEELSGLFKAAIHAVRLERRACSRLLFSPWIVRRTVHFDFPRFHLVVIRGQNGGTTRAINYGESLSVAWLLIWRTDMIMSIVHGLVSTSVWLVRGARPVLFDSNYITLPGVLGILRVVLQEALGLLVFLLWVNRAAIKKNYARFSLRIERAEL